MKYSLKCLKEDKPVLKELEKNIRKYIRGRKKCEGEFPIETQILYKLWKLELFEKFKSTLTNKVQKLVNVTEGFKIGK